MKNILIVFTVLAMASVANAALKISVDGVVSPAETEVYVDYPSGTAVIDIHAVNQVGAVLGWLTIQGPGSIDASSPTYLWEQSAVENMPDPGPIIDQFCDILGVCGIVDIIDITVQDISEPFTDPDGLVIDGLQFHCADDGDVTLILWNAETFEIMDTVVIHQVPEPMTFALLGLGGLFLRRRR